MGQATGRATGLRKTHESGGNNAQNGPPPNNDGDGGGDIGVSCPSYEQFFDNSSLAKSATPLRGNIGCVDLEAHALRTSYVFEHQDAFNIYGRMEAGFRSTVPGMSCLGDNVISGGIDTNLAELMVEYLCPGDDIQVLDACGGHAVPYHYHERMSCLYEADPLTGHSTRVGTAGDGNGIYGKHIDGGVEPNDLDACGGRFGITPDSNGEVVYYYSITSSAPFSLGCYGPVSSVQECRDMYDTCGDGAAVESVTTLYGTGLYTLDCPCFDADQSNVPGQGRPVYLPPVSGTVAVATVSFHLDTGTNEDSMTMAITTRQGDVDSKEIKS